MENVDRRGARRLSPFWAVPARFLKGIVSSRYHPLYAAAALLLAAFLSSAAPRNHRPFSEGKPPAAATAVALSRHRHAAGDEDVPLLFLVVMGVGALALSHTRPSTGRGAQMRALDAGKNGAARKELPEHATAERRLATR